MKKWLLVAATLCVVFGVAACGEKTTTDSTSETSVDTVINISAGELVEKNIASEILKTHDNLYVSYTEKNVRNTVETKHEWYYTAESNDLSIDYIKKDSADHILEKRNYRDGACYMESEGRISMYLVPCTDMWEIAQKLTDGYLLNKEYDAELFAYDGEIVLSALETFEDGSFAEWNYRFDQKTYAFNKAVILFHNAKGTYEYSAELKYIRDYQYTPDCNAYETIIAKPQTSATVVFYPATAQEQTKTVSLPADDDLYVLDILGEKECFVYTDKACTNLKLDLRETADGATLYVNEAKEGDAKRRDMLLVYRDNDFESVMNEYGTYLFKRVDYLTATDPEESDTQVGTSTIYFSDNRTVDEEGNVLSIGDWTYDYYQSFKADGSTVTNVINVRDGAFFEKKGAAYSLKLINDPVQKPAIIGLYPSIYAGQTLQSGLEYSIENKDYILTTTKTPSVEGSLKEEWTYHFNYVENRLLLQKIDVKNYGKAVVNEKGEEEENILAYSSIVLTYGKVYKDVNSSAFDTITMKNNPDNGIKVTFLIDYRTINIQERKYTLMRSTAISILPKYDGTQYVMYKDSTCTRTISSISEYANSIKEANIYVVPKA